MSGTARTPKDFKKGPRFHSRSAKKHLLRQSNICALCNEPIVNMKDATIDHKVPVSQGGQDNLQNLQLAHDRCNQKKGNKRGI